jgi:hypothetical protein
MSVRCCMHVSCGLIITVRHVAHSCKVVSCDNLCNLGSLKPAPHLILT